MDNASNATRLTGRLISMTALSSVWAATFLQMCKTNVSSCISRVQTTCGGTRMHITALSKGA